MTVDIELKASLNTDTFAQSLTRFGDVGDNLINTGIERLGGITNIYEKESTYAQAGERVYTEDGKEISLTDSSVADYQILSLDGVAVGQVSEYGVEKTTVLDVCDDSFLDSNSYTTAVLRGNVITLTEFDFDKVQLNTRSITFTNLGNVLLFYTSLSFVQYQNQHYVDSQEFALRLGEQVFLLKESNTTQAFPYTELQLPDWSIYGTLLEYKNMLICAGPQGISSYDGSAWKYYNGTGSGTGIFNDGSVVNGSISGICLANSASGHQDILVVWAGVTIGSYNGSSWDNYHLGVGLVNNGSVLGTYAINGCFSSGQYLLVYGVCGRIGSYLNGSGWTNYNAGSGICNNGTALSTDNITAGLWYTDGINPVVFVFGSALGKIASYDLGGAVWRNYNSGAYISNNGVVVGTTSGVMIMSKYAYGGIIYLVVALNEKLGSFNGSAWTNYNAGSGLCNNNTVVGGTITALIQDSSTYLLVGAGPAVKRLGAWNGTAWINYNSAQPYSSIDTGINISSIVLYKGLYAYSGTSGINTITGAGIQSAYYNIVAGTKKSQLFNGMVSLSYTYMYRYENGKYLLCLVGNNLNELYIIDMSTKDISISTGTYAVPQVKNNYTRHIITAKDIPARHLYNGSNNITAYGLVGFFVFTGAFTPAAFYQAINITLGNGFILKSTASYGYCDFTFRTASSATNVFNYTPQFKTIQTDLFDITQGNTDTLINAYGRLNNNIDVPVTKGFEFRAGMIEGLASFISVAIIDTIQTPTLGVVISNIGEFDDSYQPQIVQDDKIMYLSNGSIVIKKIGIAGINKIQQISPTTYKINTISPLNILDTNTGLLHVGSCDYNNRMLFNSTVAPGLVSKVASLFEGDYSNSVDTGDKLVTINPLTSANIQVIGARIPVVSTSTGDYAIDTYIEDNYAFSTFNDGSELVKPSKENLVYAETPIIPVAIGQTYSSGITTGNNNTIFLKPDYDGYSIGNDIAGVFTLFKLYGQTYLFDGVYIYSADIDATGIFSSKTKLAPAGGLRYIAFSPTEITFLSTFDNSVYTFTGGRNLSKAKRFTSVENINSGVFDVRENTLVLDTDTTIIFIRDSLATLNNKKASQTGVKYYPTAKGVIISNNINSWQYTYDALPGSTVVPLDLKTGYYGFENTNNSILQSFIVTIYNENRTKVTIDAVNYTIQADDDIEQATRWVVNPGDYNKGGYARLRIVPKEMKTLGSSLRVTTNDKIMLVSLRAEIETGEKATVAKNRTV